MSEATQPGAVEVNTKHILDPVEDDPRLEALRQEILAKSFTVSPEEADYGSVKNMFSRDTDHFEPDYDTTPAGANNAINQQAALPCPAGQNFFVVRHSEARGDTPNVLAMMGVFATENEAERHVARLSELTKGQPFNYVIGEMLKFHPWPPTLDRVAKIQTDNQALTEIMQNYIERRQIDNVAFRNRIAATKRPASLGQPLIPTTTVPQDQGDDPDPGHELRE